MRVVLVQWLRHLVFGGLGRGGGRVPIGVEGKG